jgi:hypothetical protein
VLKLNQEVSRVMHVHLPLWRGMCVHQLHYLPVDETLGGFLFALFGRPTELGSVIATRGSYGKAVSAWTLAVVVAVVVSGFTLPSAA